jgi:predicted DsbA family dithiol-disulfide isomerase
MLAQINSNEDGSKSKAWEQPDTDTRGLLAFKVGISAMKQGDSLYDQFHINVLEAKHVAREDLGDLEVLMDCAKRSGLDMKQLQIDINDPSLIEFIGSSHTEAVTKYGVFGVPTFVFPNGNSAFLKLIYPPKERAADIYKDLMKMMSTWDNIGEIKRPQPPWPSGVTRD